LSEIIKDHVSVNFELYDYESEKNMKLIMNDFVNIKIINLTEQIIVENYN